jgi:leader peptidase (prepilin peptidase)/N-methyltransferase
MLYLWLVPLLLWLFLLGASFGSFLNVCIARLPPGRSLSWPGSHCGRCFRPVRLRHNVPLVSYWWLRGRCKDCGATFSVRYFLVELFAGVTFVALYLIEVGFNIHGLPVWERGGFWFLEWGQFPPSSWVLFALHASLACLLIAATGCLLEHGRVPAPLTATGLAVGLAGATLCPWPWPNAEHDALFRPPQRGYVPLLQADGGRPEAPWRGPMPVRGSWARWPVSPRPGFYPWPVWGPLPSWLPAGSWRLGLATGLAGALVASGLLRMAAWVSARVMGREPARPPGTDVLLIAGAFLGWQPAVTALALGAGLWLVAGTPFRLAGRRPPPLGLWLALGVTASWLGWAWLGPLLRPVLFNAGVLAALVAAGLALVATMSLLARRRAPAEAPLKTV